MAERKRDDTRILAEKIAQRLFTNGSAERAQRLVLTIDKPVGRDLGGWSIGAATDHIEEILRAGSEDRRDG
jgi:hypothetical protein